MPGGSTSGQLVSESAGSYYQDLTRPDRIGTHEKIEDLTAEELDRTFRTNIYSMFYLAKAMGAFVLTTVSTENVEFAHSLGADVVIDYKTQRFEEHASQLDMIFDLIDGDTRERSWRLLKRGGTLVSTLTAPSQERANELGVRGSARSFSW